MTSSAALPLHTSPAGSNAPELTVSELAGAIKRALEDNFGYVRLRGEISGYRGPHSSGHCYFALKDDKAKIEAVIWRGSFGKLRFKPEEGMEVVAQGRITTFPGSSKYQIVIEALEPAGIGALMAVLEERKRKLAAEGLFEEGRKRKLPFWPRLVGIVTSPTGAVIRDMLHGFTERCPTRVVVWPVRVQGETSAAEVAAAVRGFNSLPPDGPIRRPDVLIVARGGGSLEDLWGFNDESVVRAVAESSIPVISAVGHETDWTLIDLVADARAPTPTKAAEWAVPKFSDLSETTGKLGLRLRVAERRLLDEAAAHFKAAARGLPRLENLLAPSRQRFDVAERRLGYALLANTRAHAAAHARLSIRLSPRIIENRITLGSNRLERCFGKATDALVRYSSARRARLEGFAGRLRPAMIAHRLQHGRHRLDVTSGRQTQAFVTLLARNGRRLAAAAGLLRSLSYQSVLQRGFALVRDDQGHAIRQASGIAAGAVLDIEFADGRIGATAGEPREAASGPNPKSKPRKPPASNLSGEPRRPSRGDKEPGGDSGQGTLF